MGTKEKKTILEIVYESIMFVLAFMAVATIWYATQYDSVIVWGTWAIFFVDFIIRFFTAEKKWHFIRSNPFMLIAIVPLDAVFQLARVARLLHFMRLKVITQYYTKPLIRKLEKQKFSYVIPVGFLIVFICILPLYLLEPGLETYFDAFIGGMLSLVFFGYTAINPQTTIGTVIITLLTIVGVVMHGVVISILFNTITNFPFVKKLLLKIKMKSEKQNQQL
ncbi:MULTISPECIES: hypothetical protein [Bacillaceae]|uniref:Voltage-gated potassium channel n=1 Tax=Evansella alkalicola TaxID=745819 RepID=A0ABS6JZD9_9BACI|nr:MULTISPECIES: hypothetical protein [Bacillaceae]MBU9723775.1 hypothetical protein [Bacillus alkalicola]